jgi:hypothetical protein
VFDLLRGIFLLRFLALSPIMALLLFASFPWVFLLSPVISTTFSVS